MLQPKKENRMPTYTSHSTYFIGVRDTLTCNRAGMP